MTIKPGKTPKQNAKRDFLLVRDYQWVSGTKWLYTVTQLVAKYLISSSRIFDILKKLNIPKRGAKPLQVVKTK